MPDITIFIEDSSIKLLAAKGRKITKWVKLPLEAGLVSDGIIVDEPQVAEKIKELLKLQKISERTVTAGMSGFNSVYRLLSMPAMTPELLPEAVIQEAGRVVPVPMDQVYISYQEIPSEPGTTNVFLAAYPRNSVDTMLNTLQAAGLRVNILDLAPLALCRTVDVPRAILINASDTALDIAVMMDKVPQLIRSLSLPGDTNSFEERISSIAEELDRTITFYNSSHQNEPLGIEVPILVTGDLAMNPDTWPQLSGEQGYTVAPIVSPMQPLEGFDADRFIINIGLALRDLALEKEGENFSIIKFNALPQAEKPKKTSSPMNVALPVVIVLGIAAMYFLYNNVRNTNADNDRIRDQLLALQEGIPAQQQALQSLREQVEDLEPVIEPLRTQADAFSNTYATLGVERERIDGDTDIVVKSLPREVNLIEVSHAGDRISVSGNAPDELNIFEYARTLRSSGHFAEVVITSIDSDTEIIPGEEEGEDDQEITTYNYQFSLINDVE